MSRKMNTSRAPQNGKWLPIMALQESEMLGLLFVEYMSTLLLLIFVPSELFTSHLHTVTRRHRPGYRAKQDRKPLALGVGWGGAV